VVEGAGQDAGSVSAAVGPSEAAVMGLVVAQVAFPEAAWAVGLERS
jgi:hypothetical protein